MTETWEDKFNEQSAILEQTKSDLQDAQYELKSLQISYDGFKDIAITQNRHMKFLLTDIKKLWESWMQGNTNDGNFCTDFRELYYKSEIKI